ncbi:MAG: phenylphosphate carboxylase subunit gamma [Rhodocyclales bacterium]|nr:phenylphosphate carboxylase subunit gamma [Rhodocyclales bacterium]
MNQWEVFVMDMAELAEGKDLALSIRTLNPGRHKYTYKHVRCQVSTDLDKHPDRLQVRMGRGQLSTAKFSIQVIEEIRRLPPQYA